MNKDYENSSANSSLKISWLISEMGYVVPGSVLSEATPVVSGNAVPGSTVEIYNGSMLLGTAAVNASGNWSFATTPEMSLSGKVSISASQNGQASSQFSFTVADEGVPRASIIAIMSGEDAIYPGMESAPAPTSMAITGRPFSVVNIYDKGIKVGSVSLDDSGLANYEFLPSSQTGDHAFTVTTSNESGETAPWTLSIADSATTGDDADSETTPEPDPVIAEPVTIDVQAYDNENVRQYFPSGGTTDDSRPTFTGTAGANQIVTLHDEKGRVLGSVQAGSTGKWRLEITESLENGAHAVTARSLNQESSAFQLNVKAADSTPVTFSTWAYDSEGVRQYFASGDTTDDSRPTFFGTAGANEIVTLFDGSNNVLGSVRTNAYGSWSLEITQPLTDGAHAVTARTPTQESTGFNLTVQTTPITPVTIDAQAYDNENVRQYFSSGNTTDDSRPTFTGTAGANQIVTLHDEKGRVLGSVQAGSTGKWRLEITESLENGAHAVTARSLNQESSAFQLNVKAADSTPVTFSTWAYDSEGVRQYFASGDTTDDSRPTFFGTAGANEIVTLFDGSNNVLGSVRTNAYGSWSLEITQPLTDGAHAVTARTPTQESTGFNLTVQTTPITPVTIDAQAYDNENVRQYFSSGNTTDDSRPTFTGTAGANQIITLHDEKGHVLGSVQAGSTGRWRLEITESLENGTHAVTARSNGISSEAFTLTVNNQQNEVTEPELPIIPEIPEEPESETPEQPIKPENPDETSPLLTINSKIVDNYRLASTIDAAIQTTDDKRPRLSGTGPVTRYVELLDDTGRLLAKVLTNMYGKWSTELTADLNEGVNTIYAKYGDLVSQAMSVTVDSTAPTGFHLYNNAYDNIDGAAFYKLNNIANVHDNRPTFGGSAPEGKTIYLYNKLGDFLGSTKADSNGEWELRITQPLSNGLHTVVARMDGQESESFVMRINAKNPPEAVIKSLSIDSLLQEGETSLFLSDEVQKEIKNLSLEDIVLDMRHETQDGVNASSMASTFDKFDDDKHDIL